MSGYGFFVVFVIVFLVKGQFVLERLLSFEGIKLYDIYIIYDI